MKNKNILLSGFITVLLSGCMSTPEEPNTITEEDTVKSEDTVTPFSVGSVADEVFYLKTIDFSDPPVEDNLVTLTFSNAEPFGDVIKGNAGCNNYFTSYNTTRSSLISGKIATTNNKCKYDQVKLENFFFKVLSENPIIALKGDKLYLKGISNNLMFEKKPNIIKELTKDMIED